MRAGINDSGTSPSFRSVRFPDLQMFVEIFCSNLEPGWSRHVGVPPEDTSQHGGRKIV